MIDRLINENSSHIRKMDAVRDLNQIANLIEMSFPIHLDPDGQVYIQKMRKAARDLSLMGWLSPWADVTNLTSSGFVWAEDDRIVGNLSLIPFHNAGRRRYLIANVAVHPAYRRRGIAKALTQRAMGYLRRLNTDEVWLQVREDNQDAQKLYRSVGFSDRAVRTTWRIIPKQITPGIAHGPFERFLRRRKTSEWKAQKNCLEQAYPLDLRWNYPLDFSRFAPGGFQQVFNLMEGIRLRQWTYDLCERGKGQIAWQKTDSYANNLWLAFDEYQEAELLQGAVTSVFQRISQEHPISIDYPKGRAEHTLEALGFNPFRTLIWMACHL